MTSSSSPIAAANGFDACNPPRRDQLDACVHCGFCLSNCPSYRVLGSEMDSPRGRVYLMDAIQSGRAELNETAVSHFDSCLGCLACVSACPSGVQYDQLIEATRGQVTRNWQRSWPELLLRRSLFALLPYPERLRPLLRLAQVGQKLGLQQWLRNSGLTKALPKPLAALEALLPELEEASFRDPFPMVIPAQGDRRYRVGLLLGCVQRLFNPAVNEATVRVLTGNGCEVVIPPDAGCCGAVTHHQGEEEQTRALARDLIDRFAAHDLDAILINASGCGHTLKLYGHLLADDPDYAEKAAAFAAQVKDVQEFLAEVGLTAPLQPLQDEPLAIVYQDACHMIHGQGIRQQPRDLLARIPGVELREPVDPGLCCGSAGVYNILQSEVAEELGRMKAESLVNTGATVVASANIGCYVQISRHLGLQGQPLPVLHPMQLLDRSMRGEQLP